MDLIENGAFGETFEDPLKEQGTYEETTETAVKRVLAYQLAQTITEQGISKVEMAHRLATSRSQLDRLLHSDNHSVSLAVLSRSGSINGTVDQVGAELSKGFHGFPQ